MITIFFGDCDISTAEKAKATDPSAFLVDHSNVQQVLNNPPAQAVMYTSLADLPQDLSCVYQLLDLADCVVYAEPVEWSDQRRLDGQNPSTANSIHGLTLLILLKFQKLKQNVQNFQWPKIQNKYTNLADTRRCEQPQLWIAGCSHSHALGVNNSQRYGQLVSNKLNMPVSFLTAPGSSLQWQADQILRSDLRKDDIVVWGMTSEARFPWWSNQNCIKHVNANTDLSTINLQKKAVNLMLTEEHFDYLAVVLANQVLNYCNKTGVKLLLAGLLSSDILSINLGSINEFAPYFSFKHQKMYADIGSDGAHPGPKQHVIYADFCYNQLRRLKYV